MRREISSWSNKGGSSLKFSNFSGVFRKIFPPRGALLRPEIGIPFSPPVDASDKGRDS
jgi:hypothetical protein